MPLAAQEAYEHIKMTNAAMISPASLPDYSGPDASLPQTVYQLRWPRFSDLRIDQKFLSRYETFDIVDQLAVLRRQVLDQLETEPIYGILRHEIKKAELHFSLSRAPAEVEGESSIRLENLLGLLGDDLGDFFFGCPIRGIQSTPFQTSGAPTSRRDPDEHMPTAENPLKTVKVWLEIPTGVAQDEAGELRQATRAVRVEVRIYKAGGSARQFQTNDLRKCARCSRYAPSGDFSSLRLDDVVPVRIEQPDQAPARHRGICNRCANTLAHVAESPGDDPNSREGRQMLTSD